MIKAAGRAPVLRPVGRRLLAYGYYFLDVLDERLCACGALNPCLAHSYFHALTVDARSILGVTREADRTRLR